MMKTTLFSVSYAGLWGQHALDVTDFIRKAAEIGYDAVELMGKRPHLSPLDATDDYLDEVREAATECGVEVATIAGYTDFTSGKSSAEVPFVEMQVDYVRRLAEMGQALGAKNIRIFTGYTTDETAYGPDWRVCVAAVRECAEVAQPYGLKVGVQNHHDVAVGFGSYVEFLDEVDHPNCAAMYDPWSAALQGYDLYECARALAPRMVHTTLADYVRQKRFAYMPGLVNYRPLPEMVRAVPLGEGFIDQGAFLRGLKDGGFSGYVAYEMCSPLRGGGSEENLDRCASASLAKIRELTE